MVKGWRSPCVASLRAPDFQSDKPRRAEQGTPTQSVLRPTENPHGILPRPVRWVCRAPDQTLRCMRKTGPWCAIGSLRGDPWSIGARCRPAEKGQNRSPPPCRKQSSAHKKWAWARAAYGPCRSTVATTVRADRDPVSSAFHDTGLARTAREATAGYGSRRLHTAGRSTDQRWCPAPGRSSRGLLLSQKA